MMDLKKLALGTGAAILTSALVGSAAFAALAPAESLTSATTAADSGRAGIVSEEAGKPGRLEALLKKVVAAGTINQGQADAILAAAKDAAKAKPEAGAKKPEHDRTKGFVGDFLKTATDYLKLDQKALAAQLHDGKSLAEIAVASGKTRADLVKALSDAATAKIDAAVAEKKLTAAQATKLKAGLGAHIEKFVDHKAGARPAPKKK